MSGLRARSACVAMMLAAFTPLLAGCDESSSAVSAAQPNDPDVRIVIVKPQPRAVVRELPGRIAPTRVSDVRPRISGIVVERLFRQGSEVKAGDPLYRIDPDGAVTTTYSFGRPQGLAFDPQGSLFVVEALAGSSGLYRLPPQGAPELVLTGPGLVGVAFDREGTLVVSSNETAYRLARSA